MNVLVPLAVTDAMLTASSIAEPAPGETLWSSGSAYAVGATCIRTTTHRVYQCVQAVAAGRTALPEADPAYWLDTGPTLKWAAFDQVVSTQSRAVGPLTMTLKPGFFNAVAFYGLDGATLRVTVKSSTGGPVVFDQTTTLQAPPLDWYDWAFGVIQPLTRTLFTGITPYPDAELTIAISAAAGVSVGAGMVVVGDLVPLVQAGTAGGVLAGSTAEPVTYSYIKTDDYGNTTIVRRRAATDMRFKLVIPRDQADYVLSVVQRVLDQPAAWITTASPGFEGLNVFGLGSGSMSYDGPLTATFTGYVKGMA